MFEHIFVCNVQQPCSCCNCKYQSVILQNKLEGILIVGEIYLYIY